MNAINFPSPEGRAGLAAAAGELQALAHQLGSKRPENAHLVLWVLENVLASLRDPEMQRHHTAVFDCFESDGDGYFVDPPRLDGAKAIAVLQSWLGQAARPAPLPTTGRNRQQCKDNHDDDRRHCLKAVEVCLALLGAEPESLA